MRLAPLSQDELAKKLRQYAGKEILVVDGRRAPDKVVRGRIMHIRIVGDKYVFVRVEHKHHIVGSLEGVLAMLRKRQTIDWLHFNGIMAYDLSVKAYVDSSGHLVFLPSPDGSTACIPGHPLH